MITLILLLFTHGVALRWNPVNAATGYKMYRAEGDCSKPFGAPRKVGTTSAQDTSVVAGQTYSYKVSAIKNGQEGPASNCVTTTIPRG